MVYTGINHKCTARREGNLPDYEAVYGEHSDISERFVDIYNWLEKYDPLAVEDSRFFDIETKYYTKDIHKAAFVLPKFVSDLIK